MLESAEQSIVARDSRLPGLATLLDPSRFEELLQRLAPDVVIEDAIPHYLRFKPGTRCLAAFRCRVAGREVPLHAVAHGEDAELRLEKSQSHDWLPGALGEGRLFDRALGIEIFAFPNDLRVASLGWIEHAERRHELLRRTFSDVPELWEGTLRHLAYKPERRYVAAVEVGGVSRAVLKLYTRATFASLRSVALSLAKDQHSESVERLGRSQRRAAAGYGWVEGDLLQDSIAKPYRDLLGVVHAGEALASLHYRRGPGGPADPGADVMRTLASAETLGFLVPQLAARATEAARTIARRLLDRRVAARVTHGDFYAKQVVVADGRATLLDLDELGWGDPLRDLGVFGAHLLRDAVGERISQARAEAAQHALLGGYEAVSGAVDSEALELYTAAAALWIAPHFFRGRDADWRSRTERLLAALESLAASDGGDRRAASPRVTSPTDEKLPFLRKALDPMCAQGPLSSALGQSARIERAELLQHKLGRRCVIRYHVTLGAQEPMQLIGKARARGIDRSTYELARVLYSNGFGPEADDGISVPEPLGTLPAFHMWLQRWIEGVSGERVLESGEGLLFASRVAEFLAKLQRSQIPCDRIHTIEEELRILHSRISKVASAYPQWAQRLGRVLVACDALAESLSCSALVPAHRDLHPGQILLTGDRLYVLDFDLFCFADPVLDAGNFLAHITELALRRHDDPTAFLDREEALESRFLEGVGVGSVHALRNYATLSLVRHISLSTQFANRMHTTERLLDLCEHRLDVGLAHLDRSKTEAPR